MKTHAWPIPLVDQDISGPDHFVGTLEADPNSDLSVPSHPEPISGLGPLGVASIPQCVLFNMHVYKCLMYAQSLLKLND